MNGWLAEQYAPLGRVLCPGNHETYLERDPSLKSLTSNGTVLINEPCDVHGLKLFGTPIVPLMGTGFGIPSAEERSRIYAQIPIETDVLISHGPPYGVLDCAPGDTTRQGCRELLKAVRRIRPKLHVFGHVHTGFGMYQTEHTLFVNAALLGPHGDIENRPVVISMDKM